MKSVFLIILTLASVYEANSQTTVLSNTELQLFRSVTANSPEFKTKYFVIVDKNDCFNCTLSSPLIKETIDSSQVFVLTSGVPKGVLPDFISNYGLSPSFNYIDNKKLLNLCKSIGRKFTTEKSLIIEQNSAFLTTIPLKKFRDKSSFSQEAAKVLKKNLFLKHNYISAITKFESWNNGFVCFTSPKNAVYFFSKDSLRAGVKLDSATLRLTYDYVISQEDADIRKINSFEKSMLTYDQQLKNLGFSILTTQNFEVVNDKLKMLVQVSFPIWTDSSNLEFSGKLFCCTMKGSVSDDILVETIIPVNINDLPNGKSLFAYNYFSVGSDNSINLGYYLDSNLVKDKSTNYMHANYRLSPQNIYMKQENYANIPNAIVEEYPNAQNIALIHKKIRPLLYQYTYVPLLVNDGKSYELFDYTTAKNHYHSYSSTIDSNLLTDFCSINGVYYLVTYNITSECKPIHARRLAFDGRIQSSTMKNNQMEYIAVKDGLFYFGELKL
ncbi:MAG: hypothetical protein COA58_04665 [Bacteroidetes bacterium]|nr:MAG: hypothetical protein COA58_04665 [Bacteroidota bacterium]